MTIPTNPEGAEGGAVASNDVLDIDLLAQTFKKLGITFEKIEKGVAANGYEYPAMLSIGPCAENEKYDTQWCNFKFGENGEFIEVKTF